MDTTIYKQKLEDEKVKLENQLKNLGVRDSKNKDNWNATESADGVDRADEGEVSDAETEYALDRATVDSLEIQLANVVKALENIENGTYGLCVVCNNSIEEDRLSIEPSAPTCKAHMQ